MEEEGRRQIWLARRVGKDPSEISRIVNGLHPSDDTKEAIAEVLGKQIEDLWPAEATAA